MRDHDLRRADEFARRPKPASPKTPDGGADGPTPHAGLGPGAAALLHLQRSAGNAGVVQMLEEDGSEARSPVHDIVGQGGGKALDPATRSTMESRFGQGFGDVRVHTDERASASAEAVGANAYTVGSDVVFRAGHFDPATPTGQRTIAHELAHVVQQRSGPVDGSDAPGGIRLSDPGDRFERAADAAADGAMTAQLMAEDASAGTAASGVPAVQRQDPEEEEMLQG